MTKKDIFFSGKIMEQMSNQKQVDFGIITIREDEFRACLNVFPEGDDVNLKRYYRLTSLTNNEGVVNTIAIVRCSEQGTGEAQNITRDMIDDLNPKWIMVVGIGGGLPDSEISLGDVVLSSEIKDLCLEAKIEGRSEYAVKSFRSHKDIKKLITHLPAYEKKIKGWSNKLDLTPKVSFKKSNFYGDKDWVERVRGSLNGKFNASGKSKRNPKVIVGPIISSDRLIKDTEILAEWKKFIRDATAVEMEAAGVYRAAEMSEKNYPVLAIRGISDIVGFKRDPLWTEYACNVAASFSKKLIMLNPLGYKKDPNQNVERVDFKTNTPKRTEKIALFQAYNFDDEDFRKLSSDKKFLKIFNKIYNSLALSLSIFIISTVRYYEKEIVDNDIRRIKKIKPVKKIISENYTKPSLNIVLTLADRCFHLVGDDAPEDLIKMKDSLIATFLLDDLGEMLDDLNRIMPFKGGSKYIDCSKFNKNLMKFVIPELIKYTNVKKLANSLVDRPPEEQRIKTWVNAYEITNKQLKSITNNIFLSKKLDTIDSLKDEYTIVKTRYKSDEIEISEEILPSLDSTEYQNALSMVELNGEHLLHLFPFVLIKNHIIYYYRRTLATGYEYHSLASDKVFIKETKKKFNHNVFKTGSSQSLFWTEVPPTVNNTNGIKANIPDEGLTNEFIGRKRERRIITEQIIEIPNQNGIVYGPGGIGKTALILQLTEELYEEEDIDKICFDNIVWISAKSDFYDHIFDTIEPKQPQYKTLNNIFTAILSFFEFESLDEYDFDDKKTLLLEVLEQNKVLLILDNFESIAKAETDRIVKFFEIDVKKHLRLMPNQFKVIITSRVQIPSGFHQIELKGLGEKETSDLFDSLYKNYQTYKPELTSSQKTELHKATKGIPVVIKHCFAKIFEYNQSFNNTISKLPHLSNAIVQFSYKEILYQLSNKSSNPNLINILILLELVNQPLLSKQISDILELDIQCVEESLPTLISYQCLKWIINRNHEQYIINDEIRILTKGLLYENISKTNMIRNLVKRNFNINNDIPSTTEEVSIIGIFNSYLNDKSIVEAEAFIKEQLKKNKESAPIKFRYAKYLLENQNEPELSIRYLEELEGLNNISIYHLLIKCYLSLDIPNYPKAYKYICEIEKNHNCGDETYILITEFYTNWSSSLKNQHTYDRVENNKRIAKYKELAQKGIDSFSCIEYKNHYTYYLNSLCWFNMWKPAKALDSIHSAIKMSTKSDKGVLKPYLETKNKITKSLEKSTKKTL